MCGRYATKTSRYWRERFLLLDEPEPWESYNVCPTDFAPVIRARMQVPQNRLDLLRFGLIPKRSTNGADGAKFINARAETVADKPPYKLAFKDRRCLIPAIGFFEWKRDGRARIPHFVHAPDNEPIAFGGLWSQWTDPRGRTVETFNIITTEPAPSVTKLHDRMPLIIPPREYQRWLRDSLHGVTDLLKPYSGKLHYHPVATRVNSPLPKDAELIQRNL